MPKSKQRKPNASPADLADRLQAYLGSRGQSALRQTVGEIDDAADVLERMAEVLRAWDRVAGDATAEDGTAPSGTAERPRRQRKRTSD